MTIKLEHTKETLTARDGVQKIHIIYSVMSTEVKLPLLRHSRKVMLLRTLKLVQKLLPIRLHNRVHICWSMYNSDRLDVHLLIFLY